MRPRCVQRLGCASQLGRGRLTRLPVSCVESGTVRKSVGKGPISGFEGSNWTTTAPVSSVWSTKRKRAEYRSMCGHLKMTTMAHRRRDFLKDVAADRWHSSRGQLAVIEFIYYATQRSNISRPAIGEARPILGHGECRPPKSGDFCELRKAESTEQRAPRLNVRTEYTPAPNPATHETNRRSERPE